MTNSARAARRLVVRKKPTESERERLFIGGRGKKDEKAESANICQSEGSGTGRVGAGDGKQKMSIARLPNELKHTVIGHLGVADRNSLSQTSREWYETTIPFLYEAIKVELSARTSMEDPFLISLAALTRVRDQIMLFVRQFEVLGYWYECYHHVESALGEKGVVSPAVQMCNILVAGLIRRMKNLEMFRWDVQVAPTSPLIDAASRCTKLTRLGLRLSTNSTGSPYAFPDVTLLKFNMLKSLELEAVNSNAILRDIARLLEISPNIKRLKIEVAYQLEGMPLAAVFSKISSASTLHLEILDVRGFDDLRIETVWKAVDPSSIKELTVRCSTSTAEKDERDIREFWKNVERAKLKLRALYTDMVNAELFHYIGTYDSIEELFILPRAETVWGHEDHINNFVQGALARAQPSLRRLGLYSRDSGIDSFTATPRTLQQIAERGGNLIEWAIQIEKGNHDDVVNVLPYFHSLRAIHIVYTCAPSEAEAREKDHMKVLDSFVLCLKFHPELPLRYVAVNFEVIYELLRIKGKFRYRKRSPKDWVDCPSITLFSQNLWEW